MASSGAQSVAASTASSAVQSAVPIGQPLVNEEIGTPTDEVITSFIWCDGHICVSYYNISSLDLYITYETVDLRPDFCHLHNLFRIMPNMRNVLASGPDIFLTAIMKLVGLPEKMDPAQYRLHRLKSLSAATFVVYSSNEKTLVENRQRILEMHMPRMNNTMTDQERFNFIETVVPLHQTLVVQCLGNLLHFLNANWNHLFLREETRCVVSDVKVYKLETNVLIDDSTFSALQVFAMKDHPSGFKKGGGNVLTNDSGPSLFAVMNKCVSRLGSNQLKAWLYQPTMDVTELARRHHMIEWCRNEKNAVNLTKFRAALKKIVNAGEVYARLVRTRGKPSIWKIFKRSLYYTNEIANICVALVKFNAPDIIGTVIEDFGKYSSENTNVYNMLQHIDTIIDLDLSIETGVFTVRSGLDASLDEKKEQFAKARDELQLNIQEELHYLPSAIAEVTCHFVAEMGFLIALPSSGYTSPQMLENGYFKFAYQLQDKYYFSSPLCAEMSARYGHLHVDIREREQEICDGLIEHLYERLHDIHHAISFCAELDCLMALALFSLSFELVRPQMVTDRKILQIKNGQHLLVALQRKCVPNDTLVSVEKKNLINILIAPNASGKSVYMKAVAQITYLAHIGSYVPATEAIISVVDAIYTRLYSPESMYLSKSSFLIELQQMSNVIMNSSSKSLILVDELGQGTSENDGKSLLLSCLEHLAGRGNKAPISFVTTHYTDVYDFMVNTEWVAMKTFEMTPAVRGGLLSTFKVIDGKCAARYAKDCALLRRFMKTNDTSEISSSAAGPSTIDDNRSHVGDKSSTDDQETLENIEATVRTKKITCAVELLQAFLNAKQGEVPNYMKILDSYKI